MTTSPWRPYVTSAASESTHPTNSSTLPYQQPNLGHALAEERPLSLSEAAFTSRASGGAIEGNGRCKSVINAAPSQGMGKQRPAYPLQQQDAPRHSHVNFSICISLFKCNLCPHRLTSCTRAISLDEVIIRSQLSMPNT